MLAWQLASTPAASTIFHLPAALAALEPERRAVVRIGMANDRDGKRPRFYSERMKVEAQQGQPFRAEVSEDARRRLMREVRSRCTGSIRAAIAHDFDRVLGESLLGGGHEWSAMETEAVKRSRDHFLTMLEVAAKHMWLANADWTGIHVLQSILADDLSSFRLQLVDPLGVEHAPFEIHNVENEHLHREIVDRTFELTRELAFASAQRDYAEAWVHYSRGDLDDAVVNAHKAFESACKIVITRVDPNSAAEEMQTKDLVPELRRLDILPPRMQTVVGSLVTIFMNAGSLRNTAGTGHGSLDLSSPEATTALFALRLSGSLVIFLADRWKQMRRAPPASPGGA